MATIVFVDDHPDTAETFARLVRARGHPAYAFSTGKGLVQHLLVIQPDVLFADLNMPAPDGFELARAIRAERGLRHLYLVAFSARGISPYPERAEEAGFDELVLKQHGIEGVMQAVRNAEIERRLRQLD